MIAIIALFVLLLVAAISQIRAGQGPQRYPGPGFTSTPAATASPTGS